MNNRGVTVLGLHCIYIFIGIATLALNLVLTVHLIIKYEITSQKKRREGDGLITFSLAGKKSSEDATTVSVPYDDTLPLE